MSDQRPRPRAREPRTPAATPEPRYQLTEEQRAEFDPPHFRHPLPPGLIPEDVVRFTPDGTPLRTYTLLVPAVMKLTPAGPRPDWLTSNDRRNVHAANRLRQAWKDQAVYAARNARLPKRGPDALPVRVVATAYYHVSSRKRDASNLADTLKPILDGLTVYGFWPDDNDEHVYHSGLEPGGTRTHPAIVLAITEQPRKATP